MKLARRLLQFFPKNIASASAEMAFHFTLSLFPLLISIISLIFSFSSIFEQKLTNLDFMLDIIPPSLLPLVQDILANSQAFQFNLSTLFPIAFSMWAGANGGAIALKAIGVAEADLNVLSLKRFWLSRIISVLVILAVALVFTMMSFCLFFANAWMKLSQNILMLEVPSWLEIIGQWMIFIAVISLLIGGLYWLAFKLHKQKALFKQCLTGGLFFSLIWTLSSQAFSLYLQNFGFNSLLYDSLGSVPLLMIWLYVTSMSWILGARMSHLLLTKKP